MFGSNAARVIAGSRFTTYGGCARACRCAASRCTNVDLPAPAMPIVMITDGLAGAAVESAGAGAEELDAEELDAAEAMVGGGEKQLRKLLAPAFDLDHLTPLHLLVYICLFPHHRRGYGYANLRFGSWPET
jgi:hypothetical protein